MEIEETTMEEITQEAKYLLELIHTGESCQRTAKRLAIKSFIAGMNAVMPNVDSEATA